MFKLIPTIAAVVLTATAASAETTIRFSNDWRWEGPAAPLLLALDRGYYAEEGLTVTMDPGAGSLEAIPRVASGTYQMGAADLSSLIKFRDQNPDLDVKAIFMIYDTPAFSIVGRKSLGVETPKDLEGRTLGAPATDGAFAQWQAFVNANDIDADQVTIENVGFPVREPMLAQGEVDAITGFSFSSFINLKAAGVAEDDITVMLMNDYGLDLYGNVIIVNPQFAESNPDAVRAFLTATMRGFQDTFADPEAAVEYVVKYNDVANGEVELERLVMAIEQNMITDDARANGFGGVDMERLARSMDQIAETYDFTDRPEPEDVFDTSFLPDDELRAVE